jgi:hypothetical protein
MLDSRFSYAGPPAPALLTRLLCDDAIRPLHQRNENRWTAKLRAPLAQVCFRDPTGPGTGPSSEYWNAFGDHFIQSLAEWRPAYGLDCVHRGLAHGVGPFANQENLHVMTGLRQD